MKKIILALLCICAMTTAHTYAMDVGYDCATKIVTVSGKAKNNESLAIIVTNSGLNSLEGVTAVTIESQSVGIYELQADSSGEYSLSFKLDKPEGTYNIFVSGKETKDSKSVDNRGTLKKLNTMVNKIQVKDLITELKNEYGGNNSVYNMYFSITNTDSIDRVIFEKKPYGDLSEAYKVFEQAVNSYQPPKTTSGSGGGGGGGGRGGVTYPTVAVQKNKETIQNTQNIQNGEQISRVFEDVPADFWGAKAINELYEMGIINGVSSTEFAPDKDVKREEFVKMLVSLIGLDVSGAIDTFNDTDKNAWYSPYIAVAKECGIVSGKDDGSFGIGEVLTRQDMAVFASKVLGTTQRGESVEFEDADQISEYAKNSVEILCSLKVMNGVGDGRFEPKGTATRAQAAKVIYEIAKLIK